MQCQEMYCHDSYVVTGNWRGQVGNWWRKCHCSMRVTVWNGGQERIRSVNTAVWWVGLQLSCPNRQQLVPDQTLLQHCMAQVSIWGCHSQQQMYVCIYINLPFHDIDPINGPFCLVLYITLHYSTHTRKLSHCIQSARTQHIYKSSWCRKYHWVPP